MNFVLLMLLDVNRVNAASYPELQIRGGGGGDYSCQTMNFVLLMLLDVNRVNAASYPELQIRGGGGGL